MVDKMKIIYWQNIEKGKNGEDVVNEFLAQHEIVGIHSTLPNGVMIHYRE